jgi:hypothetical protein
MGGFVAVVAAVLVVGIDLDALHNHSRSYRQSC